MDAGIADTLNRHVAQLIAKQLDKVDEQMRANGTRMTSSEGWHHGHMADTLMGDNDATDGDRAWLVGMFAARTPGVDFDGHPADCDWENLFSHFRAEILARRDPQTPCAGAASPVVAHGVGSQ
jgi:hypothetical protein